MKLERWAIKLLIWLSGRDERTMEREQQRYDRKRRVLAAKYGEEYWRQRNGTNMEYKNVKRKAGRDDGYVGMNEPWIGMGDWLVLGGLAGVVLGVSLAWWRLV